MFGNGGGARPVEPESLARFGADGDKALAAAGIGDAHHVRSGERHRVIAFTDNVADQDHFRPSRAPRLGGIANGLQVAFVKVFQAGENGAARPGVEVILDLDDGGHRVAHLAEKLEADGAHRARHAVQDEAR